MNVPSPFPASVIRLPSPTAACTCEHWIHCDHACHGRRCDPTENSCDVAFLPDEGGLTRWGCADCTPGEGAPHYLGCELIGWSVPARREPLGWQPGREQVPAGRPAARCPGDSTAGPGQPRAARLPAPDNPEPLP